MDQTKMTFVPHVIVVLKGTTVDFLNSDPVGHNVYWPSISGNKKLAHNWAPGRRARRRPSSSMISELLPCFATFTRRCPATWSSSPTPYFAVTDKTATSKSRTFPPGKYTLKTWSEDGKASHAGR